MRASQRGRHLQVARDVGIEVEHALAQRRQRARGQARDSVPTKSDTSAAMAASWSFETPQCREFGTAFGDRQRQLRATNQQRDKPSLRQSERGGLRGQGSRSPRRTNAR